jgi:hypothetical protein
VNFYLDSNRDGVLDAGDTLVGVDAYAADGWSAYVPLDGYAPGTDTFFAQAVGDDGTAYGRIASATVTVAAGSTPGDRFAFGPAGAPAAAGSTPVAPATVYTAALGYGWTSGAPQVEAAVSANLPVGLSDSRGAEQPGGPAPGPEGQAAPKDVAGYAPPKAIPAA